MMEVGFWVFQQRRPLVGRRVDRDRVYKPF